MMHYEEIIEGLGHALDEHLTRMAQINKTLLLSGASPVDMPGYDNQPLQSLRPYISPNETSLDWQSFTRLNEIQEALNETCAKIRQNVTPDVRETFYAELCNLSNEFINRLRRFELDLNKEENGIDPLTGLRSQTALLRDLERELSACARRKDYLGVALGKIDNYALVDSKLNADQKKELVAFIASILRQNMRLYDDGYRYNETLFVLSLKHTDQLGAIAGIERFARMLDEVQNTLAGRKFADLIGQKVTLSYSVSRLEVGTNIIEFLQGLKRDIEENATESTSILEYEDESNLAKYLRAMEEIPD
ncbi:MAG: diguanylate cyclase [Rhodospirillales bacterium]|nr:diguanylate cyclase [Rhodospirillales bacterium]MCB9972975.1 diguanylate cyclase [Rhodospirillales bacterium]MCB9980037.1 diguanylate cyclase [Rhodospirillales bacterium]